MCLLNCCCCNVTWVCRFLISNYLARIGIFAWEVGTFLNKPGCQLNTLGNLSIGREQQKAWLDLVNVIHGALNKRCSRKPGPANRLVSHFCLVFWACHILLCSTLSHKFVNSALQSTNLFSVCLSSLKKISGLENVNGSCLPAWIIDLVTWRRGNRDKLFSGVPLIFRLKLSNWFLLFEGEVGEKKGN